jgi:hypothetical protein
MELKKAAGGESASRRSCIPLSYGVVAVIVFTRRAPGFVLAAGVFI